jgi:hypothetical protein
MIRNSCTRIFTFILSLIYLQGCATTYVIDQARGIKPISYGIESAWIDSKNQEFVLCLLNKTGLHKKNIDHFLIRIPKDIINTGGSDNIDYNRRDVSKLLLIKKVLSLASILTFWVPEERFHDIREFL